MGSYLVACGLLSLVVTCRLQSVGPSIAPLHVGSYFLTRDKTHVPSVGRQILNHWTAREVPEFLKCVLSFSEIMLTTPPTSRGLSFQNRGGSGFSFAYGPPLMWRATLKPELSLSVPLARG